MPDEPDERPIQTPRAWRELTRTLGVHVPKRLGEVRASGRRIAAMGAKRPPKAKGK